MRPLTLPKARCWHRSRRVRKASPNHQLLVSHPRSHPGLATGQGSRAAVFCSPAAVAAPCMAAPPSPILGPSTRVGEPGRADPTASASAASDCSSAITWAARCCIKASHPELMRNGTLTFLSVSQDAAAGLLACCALGAKLMLAAGYLVHQPHCAHLRHKQCLMQGALAWCLTPCKADSAPLTSHDGVSQRPPACHGVHRRLAMHRCVHARSFLRGADACPAAQASSHAQRRRRLPQCACQRPD